MTAPNSEARQLILDTVEDAAKSVMYYDRKEDEDLPRGAIAQALTAGVITVDEMAAHFAAAIRDNLCSEGEAVTENHPGWKTLFRTVPPASAPVFEPDFQVVTAEFDEEGNQTIHEIRLRGSSTTLSGDALRDYLEALEGRRDPQVVMARWLGADIEQKEKQ